MDRFSSIQYMVACFSLKFGDVSGEFERVMNNNIAKNSLKSLAIPTA